MDEVRLLQDMGLVLVAAAAAALAARPLRLPSIVAWLMAGLMLGPILGWVVLDPATAKEGGVGLAAKIGIALLLFLVGLELSFRTIRDIGAVSVLGGVAQMGTTALVGWGVSRALGFPGGAALFIGIALSFSSTVVVVRLLEERGDLQDTYGRISVGILLVQDLAVVIVMTVLAGIAAGGGGGVLSTLRPVGIAFGGMALLVVAAFGIASRLFPRPFAWISRFPEALLVWSLAWCFLLIFAAGLLGLSLELGAFLAGISLAQLPWAHALRRRVAPLVTFFLALFFVGLGIQMDLGSALADWSTVLALTAFVLLGKPILLLLVVPRLGFGERTATLAGITLGQASEFAFILAGVAQGIGLIDARTTAVIGGVGILTMGTSAVLIPRSRRLYAALRRLRLLRIFRAPHEGRRDRELGVGGPHGPGEGMRDHVIVVGMNALGRAIVQGLQSRGVATLAIDTDPAKLEGLGGAQLVGSADDPEMLHGAGIERARLVVSALRIEDANLLLAWRSRLLGVPVAIHAFDPSVVEELLETGVTHLMDSKMAGARGTAALLGARGIYG